MTVCITTNRELTPATRAVYEANKHKAYKFGLISNCHLGSNEAFQDWLDGVKAGFPVSERLRLINALYEAYGMGEKARQSGVRIYEIKALGLTAQYEAQDMDIAVAQVLHDASEVRYSEGSEEGWYEFWTANSLTSMSGFIRQISA